MQPAVVLFLLVATVYNIAADDSANGTTPSELPSTSATPSWRFWRRNVNDNDNGIDTQTTAHWPSGVQKRDVDVSTTGPYLNFTDTPVPTSGFEKREAVTSFDPLLNATSTGYQSTQSRVRRDADNAYLDANVTTAGDYPSTHSLVEREDSDFDVTTSGYPTTLSRAERHADHTSQNHTTAGSLSTHPVVRRDVDVTTDNANVTTPEYQTSHSLSRREAHNGTNDDVNVSTSGYASTHSTVRHEVEHSKEHANFTTLRQTTHSTVRREVNFTEAVNVTTAGYTSMHSLARREVEDATDNFSVTTSGYTSTHSLERREVGNTTGDTDVTTADYPTTQPLAERDAGETGASAGTTFAYRSTHSQVERHGDRTTSTDAVKTLTASALGRSTQDLATPVPVQHALGDNSTSAGLMRRDVSTMPTFAPSPAVVSGNGSSW
ncbi:unnamed protein product [Ixodes persulcatus]